MQDTRGLDDKYPNEEDSIELAETLNGIADFAVDKIMKILKEQK